MSSEISLSELRALADAAYPMNGGPCLDSGAKRALRKVCTARVIVALLDTIESLGKLVADRKFSLAVEERSVEDMGRDTELAELRLEWNQASELLDGALRKVESLEATVESQSALIKQCKEALLWHDEQDEEVRYNEAPTRRVLRAIESWESQRDQ